MIFTTVSVLRNGSPVSGLGAVAIQADQKSLDMQSFDAGAAPYDLYTVFIQGVYDIRRNDKLSDNNSSTVYTVSAHVEPFFAHMETEAMVPVGS